MKASEKFRNIQNSPVGYIARYYTDVYLAGELSFSIGELLEEVKTGKTPSKSNMRFYEDAYFDWFKPDEIGYDIYLNPSREKLSSYAVASNQVTIFQANTLLINCIGDIGRVAILKHKASSNQQITGILFKKDVLPEYAYFYLLSHRSLLVDDASSTTLPIINQKKLLSIPIKKPTILEQEKIVSLLKYAWQCLDENKMPSFEDFNFPENFTLQCKKFFVIHIKQKQILRELQKQQDQIQLLRQTILQEAVQGKLTPHVETDEPASDLLKRIKAEKQKLVKAGKLKKEKDLPTITEEEIPFELPKGWVWCRLGEIINEFLSGFAFKSPDFKKEGTIQVLRLGNVKNNKLLLEANSVFINENISAEASSNELFIGDILITMTGTRLKRDYCFTVLLNGNDFNGRRLFLNQRVGCMKMNVNVDLEFMNLALKADKVLDSLFKEETGTANQGNIGVAAIKALPFPLPPLSEQKLITIKVKQLMQLVNELEQQVTTSQTQARKLLQAVLKEAFEEKRKEFSSVEELSLAVEV